MMQKNIMTRVLLVGLAFCTCASASLNSSTTIKDGVLLVHHPLELTYTSGVDWCDEYHQGFAISSCNEQHCRIDLNGNQEERSVWYVIAAFADSTVWGGAEFGFGKFDARIYGFIDWGPCYPSGGLEIHTEGWPGPEEGTSLVTTVLDYTGNFLPCYSFVGYAYSQGAIPLDVNPAKGFAGNVSRGNPAVLRSAEALGTMGIFQDGVEVCPSTERMEEPMQVTPELLRARVLEGMEPRGREIPAIARAMDVEHIRSVLDRLPVELVDRLRKGPLAAKLGLKASESDASGKHETMNEDLLSVHSMPGPIADIYLTLPRAGHVVLRVYDASGRLIDTPLEGERAPGSLFLSWPAGRMAADVSDGTYYLRLSLDGERARERQFTLVR